MILGMFIALGSYLSLASSILIAIPLRKLDRSCIFIATSQSAGSTASITGRFCLSFPETAWVKRIKVRVRGLLRMYDKSSIYRLLLPSDHFTLVPRMDSWSLRTGKQSRTRKNKCSRRPKPAVLSKFQLDTMSSFLTSRCQAISWRQSLVLSTIITLIR